ncbi:hypothetical protein B0H63DRAFT_536777 [Podospora didyma]|uniref:Uncharacterized protein n=1 Tax=Podospora didyma TaxID=330526 RepID=A0AAE0JYZ5_9PEZI|nr:hypothetical protein B0H63DRAFT_536777 [Podospora didyma]
MLAVDDYETSLGRIRLAVVYYGKLWTTLQQPPKGDPAQEPDRTCPGTRSEPPCDSVAPPAAECNSPSSQIALRASVPVPTYGRAPGLSILTPPHLPPANSDVNVPLSESVVNKIVRDATQELIQGAKWMGQQPRSPTMAPQGWGGAGAARPEPPQFPPTHGTMTPPVAKEPVIVSILDIESMGTSANLHPITTFGIPHGCSFLSFAPSGLSLFTASSKGDVQTVWDLMRILYTKATLLQTTGLHSSGGPRVRQVAQFSRMTVARVVNVAWTRPNGERAAMVTERGTVHLLDLPSSAFTWPPPRLRSQAQDGKGSMAEGSNSAVSMASNALSSVREVARPLIARPRRSNSNVPQLAGSGIGEYATHGGKVIAASISHSLRKTSSTLNQLRHTGENRVSLPNSASSPGSSCVVWVSGRKNHLLFVLGAGLVRTFPTKSRRAHAGGDRRAPRLSHCRDFKLPSLPDDSLSLYVRSILDPDEFFEFSDKELDAGNNTLNRESLQAASISSLLTATSLDDVEPVAPRRRPAKGPRLPPTQQLTSIGPSKTQVGAWAFGQPIRASKLDLGLPHVPEEETFNIASDGSRALPPSAMERILHRTGDDDQIVVTTRRRRGAAHSANQDDDGFFEDDCEVIDFADQRV